jgi:hypothetical protein
MKILTFNQAISDSERYKTRHVLLGNGFSIACRPSIFVYGKLFERADFTKLSMSAHHVFESLETQDFERVICALRDASKLVLAYNGVAPNVADAMNSDANSLKEVLVNTIAASHPEQPNDIEESEYAACRLFLSNFNKIYTLNYDLLLYWTLMHTAEDEDPNSDDGFRKPIDDYDADYVTWEPSNSHKQNTWFLHGALHLFDAGHEIQKYTWVNTGIRLIEQIRNALNRNYFPIFVSEGTSKEKLTRIRHNDYLAKAYRSFVEIQGALFIYGHSLAENDEHFLKLIERGKLSHVYVGLYGSPDLPSNKEIIQRANRFIEKRKRKTQFDVSFFDSASAQVWGK